MVLGKKNPSTDNFKYPHSETLGLVLVVSVTTFWKSKSSFHLFAELQKKSGTKSMQEENVVSAFALQSNISSIFYWSFMKSQEENQSQTKTLYHRLCISMLRLWFNIFFLHSFCFWLFMKLQQNLFLTFHEASAKKNWKKSFMHFNAQTMTQFFALKLILFLPFHEASWSSKINWSKETLCVRPYKCSEWSRTFECQGLSCLESW